MKFYPIHQSIIDLYVSSLTLHLIQEQFEGTDLEDINEDLQRKIEDAQVDFVQSTKKAEGIFGSPEIIQDQLDAFYFQRSGDS